MYVFVGVLFNNKYVFFYDVEELKVNTLFPSFPGEENVVRSVVIVGVGVDVRIRDVGTELGVAVPEPLRVRRGARPRRHVARRHHAQNRPGALGYLDEGGSRSSAHRSQRKYLSIYRKEGRGMIGCVEYSNVTIADGLWRSGAEGIDRVPSAKTQP